MTLPAHVSEDGTLQNLIRAQNGQGSAMAYHYRDHFLSEGWITKDCAITEKGRAELNRRAGR
jgi:hypothetical protein